MLFTKKEINFFGHYFSVENSFYLTFLLFFLKVKVQWTQQLVAVQEQKTEEIKKQTELMKALADANREKEVTNFII